MSYDPAEASRMTRAEKLREAIDRAEANSHPPYPDWSADMPTRVLRAIVTELGITREMVEAIRNVPATGSYATRAEEDDEADRWDAASALSTLLDAAGEP